MPETIKSGLLPSESLFLLPRVQGIANGAQQPIIELVIIRRWYRLTRPIGEGSRTVLGEISVRTR